MSSNPNPQFRNNMSNFIRDTLYTLPARQGGTTGQTSGLVGLDGVGVAARHGSATHRTTSYGGGSSGRLQTLNTHQVVGGAPTSARQGSAGVSQHHNEPHPPTSGSSRPRYGLDLSSLLAGTSNSANSNSTNQSDALSSSRKDEKKKPSSVRQPRTMSGRPRPPTSDHKTTSFRSAHQTSARAQPQPTASEEKTDDSQPRPNYQQMAYVQGQGVVPVGPGHQPFKPAPVEPKEQDAGPKEQAPANKPLRPATGGVKPLASKQQPRVQPPAPLPPPAPQEQKPADAESPKAEDEPSTRPSQNVESKPPSKDDKPRALTPTRAVTLYDHLLTKYERREIMDYDEVYFLGTNANKIQAPIANAANFGYDDDRGDYVVCKNDHFAYRYEVLGDLGKGSFGQVVKVHDYKRNALCALKVIRNKKRFHQQAQIEIKILDHLRSRDPEDRSCTIRMVDYFVFRSHTVITFELHSMNLYELTKLNKYQPFPPALIKRFTGQLLVALSFMWREHIVHCDMKPENILLKQENKTGIKIIDFGSSCFENERIYTYIQSRFYRAPEIILGLSYGRPIDLWSLGCIICEMAIGYPIFPGENEGEQLLCIMEVIGVPPRRLIERSPRAKNFFDSSQQPRLVPNSRNKIRRPGTKDLQAILRTDDTLFVDFIMSFLKWEPHERMTPNEAMRHPWIADCFQQDTVPQAQPSTARPSSSRPVPQASAQQEPTSSGTAMPNTARPGTKGSSRAPPIQALGQGSDATNGGLPSLGSSGVVIGGKKKTSKVFSSGDSMFV